MHSLVNFARYLAAPIYRHFFFKKTHILNEMIVRQLQSINFRNHVLAQFAYSQFSLKISTFASATLKKHANKKKRKKLLTLLLDLFQLVCNNNLTRTKIIQLSCFTILYTFILEKKSLIQKLFTKPAYRVLNETFPFKQRTTIPVQAQYA